VAYHLSLLFSFFRFVVTSCLRYFSLSFPLACFSRGFFLSSLLHFRSFSFFVFFHLLSLFVRLFYFFRIKQVILVKCNNNLWKSQKDLLYKTMPTILTMIQSNRKILSTKVSRSLFLSAIVFTVEFLFVSCLFPCFFSERRNR
jgi:hypothetical protein